MRAVKSIQIDAAHQTVTVGAGIAYGELAPVLDKAGFALHNLASLPHISVGGTIATATHGSGTGNQNLSTQVRALEIVKADGSVLHLSRDHDGDTFKTAVVHIGALGIVTAVTLDLVPRFDVAQSVYLDLSFDQLEHNLESIMGSAYSVSLFTDWQGNKATQVWIKRKVAPGEAATPPAELYSKLPKDFYGATLQTKKMHPLLQMPSENTTDQMGSIGPWYARLPHFKMEFTPSGGEELQTEYFVPREHAYQAIRAVETLKDQITPHLFITELRAIKADDLPMSMAYKQDSLAIHFTWKPEETVVRGILPAIEAKLAPFSARPHWAKSSLWTGPPSKAATPACRTSAPLRNRWTLKANSRTASSSATSSVRETHRRAGRNLTPPCATVEDGAALPWQRCLLCKACVLGWQSGLLYWAGVAQLVEHLICNQRVGGSNPFVSSSSQSTFQTPQTKWAQVAEWLMAADCKSATQRVTEVRILPCAPHISVVSQ